MTAAFRIPLALIAGALLHGSRVYAQTPPSPGAGERPLRIGVVLSGGGAKGIAHIGVLQVLEAEGIVADVVTGASMGALVGGLYAIGYTPASLDSLVRSLEWESYFRDPPEQQLFSLDRRFARDRTFLELPLDHGRVTLPSGAISGQRISELLSLLTWDYQTERDFRRFPKPFAATATDLETGETVVLDSGSLADALSASMAIPSLFSPVRMNGRLLIDGGVTRNLPARDARALGADVLICSDVADPLFPASELHSLLDVLLQTVTIYTNVSSEIERPLCDVYIKLNSAGLTAADFERAPEWIERGKAAAIGLLPQLREIATRAAAAPRTPPARNDLVTQSNAVVMSALVIEGVTGVGERTVRRRLQLPDAGSVTASQLDAAVKRTYATGLFDNVRYRLESRGSDTVVIVNVDIREQDRVGIGLRYDDRHQGSALITARLRNRIGFGSATQFDFRLGEELRLAAQHVSVELGGSRVAVGATAAYNRAPLSIYSVSQPTAEVRAEVATATIFAGVQVSDAALAGIELKGEHTVARTAVAAGDSTDRRTFATASLVFRSNTMDRSAFPTRGHLLAARSEFVFGHRPFSQHLAHGQLAMPLTRRLSVAARAVVGTASPAEALPLHYTFMLGGTYPSLLFPETQVALVGLRPQENLGAAVSVVGAALQWEARRSMFVTLRSDVGQAGPELTFERDAYVGSIGAALGFLTALGPVEVSLGKQLGKGRPRIEVSLGPAF